MRILQYIKCNLLEWYLTILWLLLKWPQMQKQMVKNEKVSLEMVNVWMRADETKTEPSGMNTQRYVWRKGGTAHRHENITAAVNYGGGMNAAIWACFTASGPGQPGLIKETDEFTRVSKTLVRIVPECLRINRTSVEVGWRNRRPASTVFFYWRSVFRFFFNSRNHVVTEHCESVVIITDLDTGCEENVPEKPATAQQPDHRQSLPYWLW